MLRRPLRLREAETIIAQRELSEPSVLGRARMDTKEASEGAEVEP